MRYFGIDIHPTTLRVTIMQEDGGTDSRRYDNTPPGRAELLQAVKDEPAAVAIGEAQGAGDLRRDLAAAVETVLIVKPSQIFSTFPELGKKTFNLARMAHRAVHGATLEKLVDQSVAEVKRLVDTHRQAVETALHAHLGDFEQQATLWTDAGQEWLEKTLADLPSPTRETVSHELQRIHVLCQDSREIDTLLSPDRRR